jgi:hypothetical protein
MLAAYLLAELGGEIQVVGRRWVLRPESRGQQRALVRLFGAADGTVQLT